MDIDGVNSAGLEEQDIVFMHISDEQSASLTSINPEPGLGSARALMFQSLQLKCLHEFRPSGVPTFYIGLCDHHMDAAALLVSTLKADIIAEEFIGQQVVREIVEEQFSRFVEDLASLFIEQSRVVILDDSLTISQHADPVLDAMSDVVGINRSRDTCGVEHQARATAEIGECAYFLLCRVCWMDLFVAGPCVCNC